VAQANGTLTVRQAMPEPFFRIPASSGITLSISETAPFVNARLAVIFRYISVK
jgi:hypothetical protein